MSSKIDFIRRQIADLQSQLNAEISKTIAKRTGLKRKTIKRKVIKRISVKRPKVISVVKKPIKKLIAKRTGLKRKVINKPKIHEDPIIEKKMDDKLWSQSRKALKNYTKSFEIAIINKNDPLIQLNSTMYIVEHILNKQLDEMKGIKHIETLKVTFKKTIVSNNESKTTLKTAYFKSKAITIISKNKINESLKTSKQEILNIIDVWLSEGSGWTIESIGKHYINIVKYKPLNGSSCIKLPPELRNPSKGLINLKNNDNECFRWCHIRHLNPQEKNPHRIKKCYKKYIENLGYTNVSFPVGQKDYKKNRENE